MRAMNETKHPMMGDNEIRAAVNKILESDLFCGLWYLQQNPDVAEDKIDPALHYVTAGATEGRKPNPLFDSAWYLIQNPDVAESGINPLIHFIDYGAALHLDPGPWFDIGWYLAQNPDVAAYGTNPLSHFLTTGYLEGRRPRPL